MAHIHKSTRKLGHVKLDMAQFDPSLLSEEATLEVALSNLQGHLLNSVDDQSALVALLMATPNLFEFVISTSAEWMSDVLINGILDNFPSEAKLFGDSLSSQLLSTLSYYFLSLGLPLVNVDECHRAIQLARPVLDAIPSLHFTNQVSPQATSEDLQEITFATKRQTQRDRKKARQGRAPVVDTKPFDKLGVDVPGSQEEAEALADKLLRAQKETLQYYLHCLQKPEFSTAVRKAYLGGPQTEVEHMGDHAAATKADVDIPLADAIGSAPAAFPLIQPMKAALYFESVEGFGEWRILISTRADRNIREAKKKDRKLFGIIIKKIRELSNGHFSDDNQKRLTGSDIDIPIFEAKMTRDTRLVYQVDCVKEFDSEVERQVLRIYGIYTHAQLDRRFWDAVGQHLAGRGREYRKRCVHRRAPHHPGDNVYLPQSFPQAEIESPVAPNRIPDLRNEDKEELHALLVLEKFITFSQALLNSILADQDVAHVFQMSPAEQEVVRHRGSCYVLGRSGTGKTTTMLFKMLGIERDWDNMNDCLDEKIPHPRQIFVTQSGVLAEKVNEYYTKLSESHAAAKRTAEASAKMASKKQDHQNSGLVDRDEEEFWRGTLPKRYSDLREEHFPLFITFDHLCRLLEADLRDSNKFQLLSPALGDTCTDQGTLAKDYMSQRRDCFVSYDIFLKSYWPHFSQALKKNLDPALIFAEFMGIIKGSEQTLQSINGFMDRNAYVNLSHRQQGTFASRRDVVYTLFESYLKLKSERRHWDAADRTHAILLGLKESGVPGQKMDFVYVDEAQDNMLIDALILRTICRRPDGLFWAGDTAQTISVGSSFRFNDLKAFLYRLETTVNTGASTGAPHSFQLTANYRSHGGIVSCAHSVVQLITKFWPHSIDILAEEKGIIDGLKPIFLSGWDQDTVQYEQFLFGSSSSQLEFGAQQCILVRDDVAREKLRAQVGDIGLVLTLYESKGLEFNDVLLYNFFEDSKVDVSQWRVILNALPEEKQIKCPQFDDTRHNGVCRELKFLYVAITRARKNLWLADCSSRAEPIRTLWTSTGLVQHCTASDTQPRIAVSSKPEEWAKTARDLFDNRRYSQAARCYERALLGRERDVAHAYYLREQARETFSDQHTTYNRRSIAFLTAAQAFMRSAAVATIRTENIAYYRNAAECFVEAGDDAKAAEAYGHAEEFTRSAQLYRKAGWFDHAVEVVQSHRSSIAEADAERIIDVAKLHYFKENKLERATNLFPSLDDALQFMDNYDFNVARVNLLESTGRIAEAAELHLNEGRTVEAIRLFIQDSADTDSQRRAEECLLQGLWKQLSFGVHIKPDADISNTPLGELMELSSDMQNNSRFLAPQAQDEISMFQAIATRQLLRLRELAEKFHNVYKDPAATLLCLDHAFDSAPKMNALTHTELTSFLRMFLIYTTELQRILSDIDPSHNPLLQRLFGYHPLAQSENTIAIQSGTFLSSFISENIRKASDHMDPLTLSIWEFTSLFKNAISNRLKERVKTENTACSQAHSLSPCPAFAIFGSCNSNACYRIHLNGRDLDSDWHHTRVRIIFQQILIYQAVSGIEDRFTVQMQHRFWLEALFSALHPVHHKLGSLSALDLRRFPEAQKGLQIAKHWICDSFYTLSPWSDDSKLFMTIVAETAILGLYFDKTSAQHYINHAPCVASFKERPMRLLRGPADDPRYVVHDLLDSIDGSEKFAISAGVLFIQMVSEKRSTFGIHVMCQLIERLCASFAFAYRFQRFGSLHDLTLMRSWILRLCGDYDAAAAQSTQLLSLFLKPMANILEEVFSGSQGYLIYERSYKIDRQIRNVLVARLCRCLCLLGYNVPDHRFRHEVYSVVTSLRRPGAVYSVLFASYVNASGWFAVEQALRASSLYDKRHFDESIQLKEESKLTDTPRYIRGTRTVIFKDGRDIPDLVDRRSTLEAFVPEPDLLPETQVIVQEDMDEPPSVDEEDEGINRNVDAEAAASSVDAGRVNQPPAPPTESEIVAASQIAAFYRRTTSRRKGLPKKGPSEARVRWFLTCRENSRDMGVEYRVLYLGPLPHALACLEGINIHVTALKKKAMSRLVSAQHADLEVVQEQVDRAISITKQTVGLRKLLDPKSQFHRKENISQLEVNIEQMVKLMSTLHEGVLQEWEWDFKIAIKGILQQRKPPAKTPKPELVIDIEEW